MTYYSNIFDSTIFVYKSKNIYGGTNDSYSISIYGLDFIEKLHEKVSIRLYFGKDDASVCCECKREVNEMIKAIDGLIKPLLLTDGVTAIKASDKFNFEEFDGKLVEIKNIYDTYTTDIKEELKNKLKQLLETI